MFTQKISMDCTKEQYGKYLKDELLKMGYFEVGVDWFDRENTIVNNIGARIRHIGSTTRSNNSSNDRVYLGSFNAPLFLALAAMTNKAEGNYGEYVVGLKTGEFYRMDKDDIILSVFKFLRKATKEEIMAKFGENKTENGTEIAEKLCNDINRLKRELVNSYIGQTINQTKELEAISHLKSKGYKILKPKTWEEI